MVEKKKPVTLSWEDFKVLGNPESIEESPLESSGIPQPNKSQKLRIRLERKGRKGKTVTIIEGIQALEKDLADLSRELKNLCGTGGSCKNQVIILQGDHRQKLKKYFISSGYSDTKISG